MLGTKGKFRVLVSLLPFLLVAALAEGQSSQPEIQTEPLNASDIMARVAANQDRCEALRKEYVYKQHIHIATHKPKNRMMREETADYDVVPLPDGPQKQLKSLTGRYWNKDKYVEFKGEPAEAGGTDADVIGSLRNHEALPEAGRTDSDLIRNLRNHLLNDNSKDGLARNLFPLTSEEQKGYEFKLLGQEVEAGRNVYHIAFAPKDDAEPTWAGEAFIDAAEFQPVKCSPKCRGASPSWCGRCGSICLESGSTWSTRGWRTECGSLRASGRSSGCTWGPCSLIGILRFR